MSTSCAIMSTSKAICQPFFSLTALNFIVLYIVLILYSHRTFINLFHFSFSTFDRYKANVFSSKRERTYDMLLQDIYEKYIIDEHSLESYGNTFGGSTSINKLYGNNRKLKDQKVSSFPQKLFSTSKDLIN